MFERTSVQPVSHNLLQQQVVDASHVLFGSPPLYTSSSSAFYDHYNIKAGTAAIVALKDHDPNVPAAVYEIPKPVSTADERQALVDWVSRIHQMTYVYSPVPLQLLRNRLPSALELDSDNFQDVMNAPHKPLVVLVATAQRDLKQTAKDVGELARKWRDARGRAPVVFAWMDADKWGKWLKSMYGIKAGGLPRAVVANHTRLVYWDQDQFGETISLTSASVFSAVNGAKFLQWPQ